MSPEEQALRQVIELHRRGVPYMLTGSVASSYHGRPRATHDAEVVIDPLPHQLEAFVTDLEAAGFYVDRAGAWAALDERRQFNAIHDLHATKVDLIVREDAYSREEFARRRHVDLAYGLPVATVTAEEEPPVPSTDRLHRSSCEAISSGSIRTARASNLVPWPSS